MDFADKSFPFRGRCPRFNSCLLPSNLPIRMDAKLTGRALNLSAGDASSANREMLRNVALFKMGKLW
jgi:hypothetical protein